MVKKQFIDRKNARHFEVVHRSQRDPLAGDGETSTRVLREVVDLNVAKKENREERRLVTQEITETEEERERRVGQAALYGVYFDDTKYDYTQHLRTIGENPDAVFVAAPNKQEKVKHSGIQFLDDDVQSISSRRERKVTFDLPQDVLPSEYELSTGLMNQSALPDGLQGLQPDMDPELRAVLEALDDEDCVEDGSIDEDFIKALDEEGDYVEEYDDYYSDEEEDSTGWANVRRYKKESYDSDEEDTRTIGTSFSMSSSVMFRNDKLTLLDEQFDKIEKEYEVDSSEDSDSHNDSDSENHKPEREDLEDILDEFLDKYELVGKKMVPKLEGDSEERLETMRKAFLDVSLEEKIRHSSTVSKPEKDIMPLPSREEREREMWDCESILSTYSNLENHPNFIREKPNNKIRFDKKGFPIVEEPEHLREKKQLEEEQEEEEEEEKINKGVPRSKKETPEEKKARKAAIKEERKSRRSEKKISKSVHKEQESLRQRVLSQRAKSYSTVHLD
ncbi:Protein ltv1 [Basidiobolus ranarum]|uniref:Protein ltv1 n=1 Tax=Basidiobolus ranarum TaxID=34480 RepID=A0ABR2WMX9_9FUNG